MLPGDQYLGGLLMFFLDATRRHLLVIVIGPLVAMLIAFAFAKYLPPTYAGQGNVRMGRVDGAEAFSLQAAVSRVNSQAFKQSLLDALNASAAESGRVSEGAVESLSARAETSDTMSLAARAAAAKDILRIVQLTVKLLNEEQERIQAPLVADINAQLASIDANIASLREMRESLSSLTKAVSESQSGDAASAALRGVWLSELISRNEQRLAEARAERYRQTVRLSPRQTYPVRILDEVVVSPTPISPRPLRITFFAGGIALVAAFIYALIREGARRA